jgi:hypothetical protein
MIVIGHQQHFVGNQEYWGRVIRADRFIVSDDVQFKPKEWENRQYVGGVLLTVPVHAHSGLRQSETKIAWDAMPPRKIERQLSQLWRKAPHGDVARQILLASFKARPETLDALNRWTMLRIWQLLRPPRTRLMYASAMDANAQTVDDPSEKIALQCHSIGLATGEQVEYWCGRSGREYLDLAPFRERGIAVGEVEPQFVTGDEATSVLDLVAEYGADAIGALPTIRVREWLLR